MTQSAPTRMEIRPDSQLLLNGKPFFPIMLSPAPNPGEKAPDGREGLELMKEYGVNSIRTGMFRNEPWNEKTEKELDAYLDWMHGYGMVAALNLRELSVVDDLNSPLADHMRRFVSKYRMHPAVAAWKTMDEPQWGKSSLAGCRNAYQFLHENDPEHPAWMNHAPKGTTEQLAEYSEWCDITGVDIYPVSIPMGKHGDLPNRDLSSVGDYVRWCQEFSHHKKPIWMVLQVTWSGVRETNPVLRPTPHQERFMIYDAIISGASGLLFFGSNVRLYGQDAELGYCWSYWTKVLGPIVKEVGVGSALYPVISAPRVKAPVSVQSDGDIEFIAREIDGALYILAARRDRSMECVRATFSLPAGYGKAEVLYEDREPYLDEQGLSDYFWSHDVHVYRISR